MNNIEKYIEIGFMLIIAIMAIPVFLFLLPFALTGYIICKAIKINPDKIRYFIYDE